MLWILFPEDWPEALEKLLGGTLLDSVIDSAGGPISQQVGRVLRSGGRIVLYGMSAAQQVPFTMREVLRNQQLIGESFLLGLAYSCDFLQCISRFHYGLEGRPASCN